MGTNWPDRPMSVRAGLAEYVGMTITAKGTNGTLAFDGSFVTITRTGLARLTIGKGDKRIPLTSIAGVEWKPAGPLAYGFLQISIPGGVEQRSKFGTRTFNAYGDENTVTFTRPQEPSFERVRRAIEQAIAQHLRSASAPSVADELAKLGHLLHSGLLTQEEFNSQKARLLGT